MKRHIQSLVCLFAASLFAACGGRQTHEHDHVHEHEKHATFLRKRLD